MAKNEVSSMQSRDTILDKSPVRSTIMLSELQMGLNNNSSATIVPAGSDRVQLSSHCKRRVLYYLSCVLESMTVATLLPRIS